MVAVPSSDVAGFQREAQAQTGGRSLRQILWSRLRRDPRAVVCVLVLALSGVLTDRLTSLGIPEGNTSRIVYLILVMSVFGWPYLARIVRGQVLSLREREFVEAAVAMGSNKRRILFTEILPNLWAPILVYATLTLPAYIGLEAALSFLGVGVLPPDVTFGAMLANSVSYFNVVPTYLFIPGTVLVILVVSFKDRKSVV